MIENGLRCALTIFSGIIIFNRAMPERLRTLRHCIFTGGVVTGNGICSAAFCESAALRSTLLFAFNSSSREKAAQKRPQAFLHPKLKNIFR